MKKYFFMAVITTSLLLQLQAQEKRSAAQAFLETRDKSGLAAALSWLDGFDAEKAQQYLCDEKEFLNIGKEMKSFGDVEEAARFFESAAKLIPPSSAIWENLGAIYVRLLRKDEAVRCFQQAIAVDPKNRGAQQQLKMIDILLEDTRHETREKMKSRPGENTGLEGPYLGQRPPGLKPELFAPGIVSVFGSNENTVTLTPDGRELYFGKEAGIWVCRWTEKGWTAPRNTGWQGYEMWVSPDTGKMYYTGYEPGIWVMERSGADWGKPQKIVSNGMFSTLTRDETLYTTVFSEKGKANVGRYVKKDGKYETPEVLGPEVNSPNGFDAHPNVAHDGSFLLFDRQLPEGNRLFISFRNPDGAWTPARSLGNEFNGSLSTFSPDGKYLFFMKNRDIYWVSAKIIEELRPNEPDKPAAGVAQSQEIFDAIRNGDLAKVKELVEGDPSTVKLENQDHDTPLHMAALMDNEEMAKYLIEKGAALDALNGSLYSPLMRAGLKVAKVLVQNGADINYESANGNGSALTASLWQESKVVAEYLLDCGAKLPDKNSFLYMFFLAKALQKGSLKYFEECLKSGFDPLTVSESQDSLLHYAAESNSVELMEKIMTLGVPRNKTNIYGWTPLHVAAYNGNKNVVEFLVNKGLDKNRRTTDGHSPYSLAVEAKKPEVADYLKSLGVDQNPQEFPELKGGYMGQPKPGKDPVPFAPGIIVTRGSFHSSVTFSPDNNEAFWTSGRTTFHSQIIHGRWTKPVQHPSISSGDVPFISPDGEKLYFLSQEEGEPRYSREMISVMDKTSTGWSDPYRLPDIINSIPGIHLQLSVDRQRNLFFGARQNGTVVSRIYYSEYKNGNYGKPMVLDNLKEADARSPYISPDGGYLIITAARAASSSVLMILFRKRDGTWTKERDLTEILGLSGGCPIVTHDGKYLFFRHVAGDKHIPYWVEASFIEDLRKEALKDDK